MTLYIVSAIAVFIFSRLLAMAGLGRKIDQLARGLTTVILSLYPE